MVVAWAKVRSSLILDIFLRWRSQDFLMDWMRNLREGEVEDDTEIFFFFLITRMMELLLAKMGNALGRAISDGEIRNFVFDMLNFNILRPHRTCCLVKEASVKEIHRYGI